LFFTKQRSTNENKKTMLNKYGVESPLQSKLIQDKRAKTFLKNNGTSSYLYSIKWL
jgi:hypothetical protein